MLHRRLHLIAACLTIINDDNKTGSRLSHAENPNVMQGINTRKFTVQCVCVCGWWGSCAGRSMLNKIEHVGGGGGASCMVRSNALWGMVTWESTSP